MSDFLNRWSARKRSKETPPAEEAAPEAARAPEEDPPAEETRSDAEICAALGLPDPDQFKPGDDIRGFMAANVPKALRRRALRQLWTSNPVLANLDGLCDYAEDYTDAATVIPNLQTAYEVGKGFWDKAQQAAEQLDALGAEEPVETAATTAPEPEAEPVPPVEVPRDMAPEPPEPETPETPRARPMRFVRNGPGSA